MEIKNEPFAEYYHRLAQRRRELARRARWDGIMANTRLLVFAGGVALAWFAFGKGWIHQGWILVAVVAFLVLVVVHDRLLQSMSRIASGVEFYERGIARLEDRWRGKGWDGSGLAPADHPYAEDLDVFGPGSLFHLICTAQTRAGGKALAGWLCAPAPPDEVRARQGAVNELRPLIDLREVLAFEGRGVRAGVWPETIAAWASAPPAFRTHRLTIIAGMVSTAVILTGAVYAFAGPSVPFFWALVPLLGLHVALRGRIREAIAQAEEPSRELAVMGRMLARLEGERFDHPHLRAIQDVFNGGPQPASVAILGLDRLIRWREAGLNMIFGPVAAVLMWNYHFTRAIETWRTQYGRAVGGWLEAVGRFEALCALASHAYEHPADPFPVIADSGPLFEGRGLGHPLLPDARCVRNDIRLDNERRLLIVSGSNMSGKTVLLRTVGVNAILAAAGAPVRAEALTLSSLAVGSTINVHDALHEGVSRFYAEIKRLRALMDLARGPVPLLFLLDEIFHGTNSWDRRIGAQAVLRAFLETGAVGMVTTHDLAITQLAEELQGAANVHFEDRLENGQLVFDYRLCPGVVTKSNALDLMRAIGLING